MGTRDGERAGCGEQTQGITLARSPDMNPERAVLLRLAAFVIVGAPMALYAWHELSEALSGRIHVGPLLFSIALVATLSVGAWGFGRYLRRLEAER